MKNTGAYLFVLTIILLLATPIVQAIQHCWPCAHESSFLFFGCRQGSTARR
ncbi:MAG: hypothetical protein SGJ16_08645 [Nitrospirota bacterium]|nr:hypothetical protein [Nitrospirota bacterium]